jgi:hypothetical protein
MIRFVLGLILCMTAVDSDQAPIAVVLAVAAVGLTLMYLGSKKLTTQ